MIGATSSLLIGLIMLIKDMDNPFEVGKNSYADVDLFLLWNLEEQLERNVLRWGAYKKNIYS